MIRKNIILLIVGLILGCFSLSAQTAYKFTPIVDIETTSVKNQGQTGTCWSFSTQSFLESEIYRMKKEWIDLSEMYIVRKTYNDKAWNYVYRQGKAQFSEGGLAHDVINTIKNHGLVPQEAYQGNAEDGKYNHGKLVQTIEDSLNYLIKHPTQLQPNWMESIDAILNESLGSPPSTFTYNGTSYNPKEFATYCGIQPKDYITLTSFTHQPYYSPFILSIPDNFSNGMSYNLPLDELILTIDHALKNGYTIALDTDVSEEYFSSEYGIAVLPDEDLPKNFRFDKLVKEQEVTPEKREHEFMNFNTTDDHLMHLVGIYKNQEGKIFYKVKNSWGSNKGNGGFVMISLPFVQMKTISILLHKKAIPSAILQQLKL